MDDNQNPGVLKAFGVGSLATIRAVWNVLLPVPLLFLASPTYERVKNLECKSPPTETCFGIMVSLAVMGSITLLITTCSIFDLTTKERVVLIFKVLIGILTVSAITNSMSGIYESGRKQLLNADKEKQSGFLLESLESGIKGKCPVCGETLASR